MSLAIVESAALTDVGRQRTTNEDAFLEAAPVFAVADGMGGARAGEVAARIAVEAFKGAPKGAAATPEGQLAEVARAANRKIYAVAQEDESRAGMGTTLSAVIVDEREIAIGHVGDSRVYRLRGGALERLTHDHSLVEEFVRQGKLTPEEAEVHPQRSIITRALGPEPEVDVETFTFPARPGDVYLLCSDGLTGMVPEPRVAEILSGAPSLDSAAQQLVAAANEEGGRDNITVVLFRLGEDEAGADTAAQTLSGREGLGARVEEQLRARRRPPAGRPEGEEAPVPVRVSSRVPRRALVTAVLGLLLAAAVVIGFYVGSRQFYFVGANSEGLVTLYRGVPYELPLGISLYETSYTTTVPARYVVRLGRSCILTDHKLGTRGDRTDLVRQLEQGRLEHGTGNC